MVSSGVHAGGVYASGLLSIDEEGSILDSYEGVSVFAGGLSQSGILLFVSRDDAGVSREDAGVVGGVSNGEAEVVEVSVFVSCRESGSDVAHLSQSGIFSCWVGGGVSSAHV